MYNVAEITRQAQLIDMRSERRKLEREEEEANSRTRDELSNSGVLNSDVSELDNGNTSGLARQKRSCCEEDTDESLWSVDERISEGFDNQSHGNLSDRDGDDSSVEKEVEKDTAPNVFRNKNRRNTTGKDLDISDSFNTNMFQNKKTLHVEKMLHTMKDTIVFTENNVDLEM